MTSLQKTLTICKLLNAKKAKNIVYIDVSKKSSVCDYFVICNATSTTAVKALSEHLEETFEKQYGFTPLRRDGVKDGQWSVLDYGDVVAHVFLTDAREFYRLEHLWEEEDNRISYEE